MEFKCKREIYPRRRNAFTREKRYAKNAKGGDKERT